ncbi:Alpha/Beta hydrolase protein [Dendryphion nanum]|uniref:Alpha/Beta hydrolase protein n=1 Tax=Dendryphion nanum TaxID=256645 RepID=A0A9P9DJ35_9PLEO|nr:Alpha/Beta hydrolase protein [Dendryphion nanum]
MLSASLLLLVSAVSARTCTNVTIPVKLESRQAVFRKFPVEGNLDITAFAQEYTKNGQNYTQELLQNYTTLTGNYQISAKYCRPDSGHGSVVQLLTHGIGFDKTYWDLSFNNYNYSYVAAAVKDGYSTLAIDRFGIGNSSHGDPLNTVQAQAEVQALNEVTKKLRDGSIPEINNKFAKVVHVGHSFGSVQTYWLSSLYPNNTDGIVLTGWSGNGGFLGTTVGAWNLHSARLNQPLRFGNSSNAGVRKAFSSYNTWDKLLRGAQTLLRGLGLNFSSQDLWNEFATTEVYNFIQGYNESVQALNYPSGYMAWSNLAANQFVFLLPGFYDVALALVAESTKHPVTVGELLTIGSAPHSSSFSGPVFIITGEQDQPFCGGDCFATGSADPNIPAAARPAFPNATVFEAYIQPNTGHGINVHYNSTASYKVVNNFLAAHGLGSK